MNIKILIGTIAVVAIASVSALLMRESEVEAKSLLCHHGNAQACFDAGSMYLHGRGGAGYDKRQAKVFLEKACSLKFAYACKSLAKLYRNGNGTQDTKRALKKDIPKALSMYDRACGLGDGFACQELGFIYALGLDGAPMDQAKAFEYADKACRSKKAIGCASVAHAYLRGNGVSKNIAKAKEIFQSEYHHEDYGRKLGGAYGLGLIAEQNGHKVEALKYYAQACKKVQQACCRMVDTYDAYKGEISSKIKAIMQTSDIYRAKCK
jgi:TPR repeat protein